MAEQSSPTAPLQDGESTPVRPVFPPDYRLLRTLAESAAAVPNKRTEFSIHDRTLERKTFGDPVGFDEILIHALDEGKFPANTVSLSLTNEETPADYTLAPGVADAVFWTDAAVQKFLFPYVASRGGDNAATMLTQVQQAWNWYRTDKVTVYALVRATDSDIGVDLEFENSILVVFTEATAGAPLQAMTLREFVTPERVHSSPPPQPDPGLVDYQRGVDGTPQQPDYQTLRAMAEWAASLRQEPQYFVLRPGEIGFDPPTETIPDLLAGDIVVPAFTPTVPQGRPELGGVRFRTPSGTVTNLAQQADALFWSTAAIEDFIFPYYASRDGLEALRELESIHNTWTETSATGLVHLPTSEWAEVDAEGKVIVVFRARAFTQLGVLTDEHPEPMRVDRFIASRGV